MERRLYMVIYEGKAVFEGVAIGKLSVYKKNEETVGSLDIIIWIRHFSPENTVCMNRL